VGYRFEPHRDDTFYDDGIVLGFVTLNSTGQTTFITVQALTLGNHAITTEYGGDANDYGSTSPLLTQTVILSSTIAVASFPNPSSVGQSVTFIVLVAGSSPKGAVLLKMEPSHLAWLR